MKYEITKTNDGFMVANQYTGDYVHDEQGNNLFDLESEAKKLITIAQMRDAIKYLYDVIEEGDAEATCGLAIRYNKLFEGVTKCSIFQKIKKTKEINDKIMQKCSFVSLESIEEKGFCFDIKVDNIYFGLWGVEYDYDNLVTEGKMPISELRDMGMTKDQELQLMQEINDAMSICEDLAE